tara:strand:- start:1161 stop:1637 length:477 start_codon:yes stop_codon:yes gene_type:complete
MPTNNERPQYRRPPGRAPRGAEWSTELGQWVHSLPIKRKYITKKGARTTRHSAPHTQQGSNESVSTAHAVDSNKATATVEGAEVHKTSHVPVVTVKRDRWSHDTKIVVRCEIHKQGPISDAERAFLTTIGNIGAECACYNVSTSIGMRAMALQDASAH